MTDRGSPAKVTYVTLAGNEEANASYDAAVLAMRASLPRTLPSTGRPWDDDVCPADTSLLLARFPRGTASDVSDAIEAARSAFPAWSARPWQERVGILRQAAEAISARRAELAALMSLEVGKNRLEALGDAEESADLLRYYATQVEEADGFERPLGKLLPGEDTRSVLRPHGVFAVVAPFNFPAALAAGMIGGALVAGNTVVFKPSSEAPLTGLMLHEILVASGVPADALRFLTGRGREISQAFLDERLDGIVFTGSKQVGLDLYRRFGTRWPKPVIVEMGGKNPAVVTKSADLGRAAEGVARSAFGFGGQKCSACSRAYVAREVYDAFLERLAAVAGAMTIGDPTERKTYLGPVISAKAKATHTEAVAEARASGRIVHMGAVPDDERLARGHYVAPVVADRIDEGHRLWREELFVPFLLVAPVASLDEAIARANDTEYGLTAGIFSEDENEIQAFFNRVEAGVVYANRATGATTGAWPGVQSFCGWKASGSTGKGGCGPWYVQQFLREQSRTIVRPAEPR